MYNAHTSTSNTTRFQPECTIIILQTDLNTNTSSTQKNIRFNLPFNPNSAVYQFKSEINKYLETSKHKNSLLHNISYYSELGIVNDVLSPNDIFEIYEKDILMDCISPNDTVYMYNPSASTNTSLLSKPCSAAFSEQKQEHSSNNSEEKEVVSDSDNFFNNINLYYAFVGCKYGDHWTVEHSKLLIQITHSILVWGLRKMDSLWQRTEVQHKMTNYMKAYGFEDGIIVDTLIFGNKLTDQNAMHLIQYSPWMVSEPTLNVETYQLLVNHTRNSLSSLSSDQASLPIITEQQKKLSDKSDDSPNIIDHPHLHYNPMSNESISSTSSVGNDKLGKKLMEIQLNKELVVNGPKRWQAREGMLLYLSQFVYGLCNDKKFDEYMYVFGTNIGMSKDTIEYMLLLWESERDLARSLWNFAELPFPLPHLAHK